MDKLTAIEWVVMMRHENVNSEVDGNLHTLENALALVSVLNQLPKPDTTFFWPKRKQS